MPFESGHSLATGRPKGSSNKSTEIVKKNVALLLENNIQIVQEDLDQMQPRDRVNALLQFMKFLIPTQKAIEVDNRISQEEMNENYINKLMGIPEENFERLDE
tara:strand:+ start:68 stop:376 length:309 start_codon:yes stop_codon:yes gene_type:complete